MPVLPLAMSVIWWMFLVCLVMGLGAWMVFTWALRSGQFDDPERVAEDMLRHDRDEFAPLADDSSAARNAPSPEPRSRHE